MKDDHLTEWQQPKWRMPLNSRLVLIKHSELGVIPAQFSEPSKGEPKQWYCGLLDEEIEASDVELWVDIPGGY